MRRFRLDLAYDGTRFEGWQSQKGEGRTVQTELERAVAVLVKAPVSVVGAGRTDAGVHARGQTAHFDAQTRMGGTDFLRGLNALLPPDVRVLACREADPRFHARASALARVYHYHVAAAVSLLPWDLPYCHRVPVLPPVPVLNAMASRLFGELDFTSFTHAKDPSRSRHRYIHHASWFPRGDRLVFQITGNAFLWRMVRSLVGTFLELGRQGCGAEDFSVILSAKDRRQAGPTAPAHGLYLQKVIYHEHEFSL